MEQSTNNTYTRDTRVCEESGAGGLHAAAPAPQGRRGEGRRGTPGRGLECVIWALAFAPLVLCAVLWRSLPQQLPMQFSLDGEVNRLGGKAEFLAMCAAGPALTALLAFLPRIDPHRENYRKFAKGYRVLRLAFALFYLLAACTVPVAALFPQVFRQFPFSRLMLAALGLLFCVLGNFMPKFRHNYFCGITSPWALADEENWRRTHRFAGPLWFWGGLGVAVLSFVLPEAAMFAASFAVFLALALVPFVYSYILYKKAHANTRGS